MAIQLVLTNGELIRKARLDAGLDQSQLAAAVGVRRETVCAWEKNRSVPSVIQAKRIEDVTGALWLWSELRRYLNPIDQLVQAG